ncbi:MAG: hypothetical protein AAF657_32940 [Acidobacteriota bacterium]
MSAARESVWHAARLWLVRWLWAGLPAPIRRRLPASVRHWLRQITGYATTTGRLGRGRFALLSPPRQAVDIPTAATAYLAAYRRHQAGGPPPTRPSGLSSEAKKALVESLAQAVSEEQREALLRGESRGLQSLVPLVDRGIHLEALIQELGDPKATHVLIATTLGAPEARRRTRSA